MSNEQMEKAAFFASYHNQRVLGNGFVLSGYDLDQIADGYGDEYILLLRPLSAITDEEAIEVAKMSGMDVADYQDFFEALQRTGNFANYFFKARPLFIPESLNIVDYLRSRGFLLPFRQYSTEDLIAKGWAKIIG